jgi:hypothetical protein
MRQRAAAVLTALAGLLAVCPSAEAGWGVSVGIGVPGPYYRPYYRPYGYYGYYPYYAPAVVVAPPPVVIAPAPAVVTQPVTIYQQPAATLKAPVPAAPPAPLPELGPPPLTQTSLLSAEGSRQLQILRGGDDHARAEAAVNLGKNNVRQAIEPLEKTLKDDPNPKVREAAARALGLIAPRESLRALQTAAQADSDPEVRHSAQFAAEVILTSGQR